MLILDEPTNHLDVDAREALVQALNDYSGAVVVVSHDRHMIELTADRLVLVDNGTATEFAGSLEDYTDIVLGKGGAQAQAKPKTSPKDARKIAAEARERGKALRDAVKAAETDLRTLSDRRSEIDRAMFDPSSAKGEDAKLTMSALMQLRAELSDRIETAEARWLEASEALEEQAAA